MYMRVMPKLVRQDIFNYTEFALETEETLRDPHINTVKNVIFNTWT